MLEELWDIAETELKKSNEAPSFELILDLATKALIEDTMEHEQDTINKAVAEYDAFIKRNRERWSVGFTKLHALRETSMQAGMVFQKQFMSFPQYEADEYIGVLMRLHANACRISGEIIHLLEGGYPDAALARWRTLYEMVVTCLVIKKHGKEAAIDYIKHDWVKNAEGIIEHYKTAEQMKVETFSEEVVNYQNNLKEKITEGNSSWHWARKYTGVSKFNKLREYVGLEKWSHNYKLASRNVHSDYYEIANLHAMREAKNDILLVGQSNSGLTDPAHFTAISLSQITSIFLTAYIEEEDHLLDYRDSLLFINVIDNYTSEVGEAFLAVEKEI